LFKSTGKSTNTFPIVGTKDLRVGIRIVIVVRNWSNMHNNK